VLRALVSPQFLIEGDKDVKNSVACFMDGIVDIGVYAYFSPDHEIQHTGRPIVERHHLMLRGRNRPEPYSGPFQITIGLMSKTYFLK